MLENVQEQNVLLLRMGYVSNKYYNEQEIANILKISEEDVHSLIKRALINILKIININKNEYKNKLTKYLY